MTENEAIKHLQSYAEAVGNMIKYCKDFEPKADITGYLEKKTVFEMAVSALKEVQKYSEIGIIEECREAMANKKKCEKQWHNDMENPLEPIKVYSALKSEILKLELRIKNRPKDISILDYTVIAALQKVLKNNLEGMEDE